MSRVDRSPSPNAEGLPSYAEADVTEFQVPPSDAQGSAPLDSLDAAPALSMNDLVKKAWEAAENNREVKVQGGRTDFVNGVSPDDIHQGGIGDCYFLAALATLAKQDPDAIKRMIHDEKYDADGNLTSCKVTLNVKILGINVPIDVEVDCTEFGANGAKITNADGSGKQELWPKIIEKAYAQVKGSYDGIAHGGWPQDAMETLTGKPANAQEIGSYGFDKLQSDLNGGKLVSFWTEGVRDADNNIIPGKEDQAAAMDAMNVKPGHAYAVTDTRIDETGQKWVKLYNPWGTDQPGPMKDGWVKFEDAQKLYHDVAVGNK
jgi:hypothetical protein